ncbi:MAG: UDP-N-acetylmuramoyl-tripeptide--D-alanyl-D-alanine ligase [Solibacillus sp.]
MRPISVDMMTKIVEGTLTHGQNVVIWHGAYRLKQVKNKHTVLFTAHHLVNWPELARFFPLIVVTSWRYKQSELPPGVSVIHVNNTEIARWKFTRYYRGLFSLPVVAITGTAGKTTTKEMLKAIVSPSKKVVATHLSSNSRTAHFPYLLAIDDATETAIFETAVGAPGDVMRAGAYFQPTIGIITNIGAHHLDYCKTLEGYIDAKSEMLDIIARGGTLLINGDDKNSQKLKVESFHGNVLRVGKQATHDVRASQIEYREAGMAFVMIFKGKSYDVEVPGFGEHQVYNALFALAAAVEIGIPIETAIHRLRTFRQLNKQLQLKRGINGALLLDDTWSITTTALAAALDVQRALAKGRRRIAIIGTITDVGRWGRYVHEQAAELLDKAQVDVVVTVGEHAKFIAEHLEKLLFNGAVHSFNNGILAYELVKKLAGPETILLVKGDMYSKTMEELASKLKARP